MQDPQVGDIRTGRELGYAETGPLAGRKYIWVRCPGCLKSRWITWPRYKADFDPKRSYCRTHYIKPKPKNQLVLKGSTPLHNS